MEAHLGITSDTTVPTGAAVVGVDNGCPKASESTHCAVGSQSVMVGGGGGQATNASATVSTAVSAAASATASSSSSSSGSSAGYKFSERTFVDIGGITVLTLC